MANLEKALDIISLGQKQDWDIMNHIDVLNVVEKALKAYHDTPAEVGEQSDYSDAVNKFDDCRACVARVLEYFGGDSSKSNDDENWHTTMINAVDKFISNKPPPVPKVGDTAMVEIGAVYDHGISVKNGRGTSYIEKGHYKLQNEPEAGA